MPAGFSPALSTGFCSGGAGCAVGTTGTRGERWLCLFHPHQLCLCLVAAVACPELAAPESGRVNCSHPHGASAFSSTCDFSCQEGFEVMGPERLWCTAEGAWSGAPPHCKGRAGGCLEGDILWGNGLCVGRLQSFALGLQSGSAGDKQGSGRAASAPTKSCVWSKNPCTTYDTSMSQKVRFAV